MQALKDILATNTIRTISLFSGAGGLDIGAIYAGAQIIWANDMKKEACKSYALNIGEHIHQGDINSLIPFLTEFDNIDLVIGGPPCQGFSVAGKMDENDERSKLIWSYASVVETVQPKAFIMENVKALAVLDKWASVRNRLMQKFQDLGYSVNFVVLNACDYDVPQARERVFFIGFKNGTISSPDLQQMLRPYSKKAKTVREALAILDKRMLVHFVIK